MTERDRRRGEEWVPVERPAKAPAPIAPPGAGSKLERRRGGKTQADPKLHMFTSLCQEISAAQQRESEQQLDQMALAQTTRWGPADEPAAARASAAAAAAQMLQPSSWPVDASLGLGAGAGAVAPPPWLDARLRALAVQKIVRPQDVVLKKSFPVSSGEEHSIVYEYELL